MESWNWNIEQGRRTFTFLKTAPTVVGPFVGRVRRYVEMFDYSSNPVTLYEALDDQIFGPALITTPEWKDAMSKALEVAWQAN